MRWLAAILVLVLVSGCSEKQKEAARLEAQMKREAQANDTTLSVANSDSAAVIAVETTSQTPKDTAPAEQSAQVTRDTGIPSEVKADTSVSSTPVPTMVVEETTTRRVDTPMSIREADTGAAPDAGAIPPSEQKVTVQLATRPPNQAVSGYVVQIASSPDEADARSLAAKFTERGYSTHVAIGEVGGKTYYRVRIGAYSTLVEAKQALADMAQKYGVKGFVTQVR